MTALQEIARVHEGEFRVTPNQNLVIANVAPRRQAAHRRSCSPSTGSTRRTGQARCG